MKTEGVYHSLGSIAWVYDDGGRAEAGFQGTTNDCVVRAIAIATREPYKLVYQDLRLSMGSSPRNGVPPKVYKDYIASLGWLWTPTMYIGSGTVMHLRSDELPAGRLIVRCSQHLVAVVDGVVHDTHDSTRGGKRAVYGYWKHPWKS